MMSHGGEARIVRKIGSGIWSTSDNGFLHRHILPFSQFNSKNHSLACVVNIILEIRDIDFSTAIGCEDWMEEEKAVIRSTAVSDTTTTRLISTVTTSRRGCILAMVSV